MAKTIELQFLVILCVLVSFCISSKLRSLSSYLKAFEKKIVILKFKGILIVENFNSFKSLQTMMKLYREFLLVGGCLVWLFFYSYLHFLSF